MDTGKIVPENAKTRAGDAGQTLVEFALILLVIVLLSFGFIAVSNRNLGRLWEGYVRLIVDDPTQNGALTIPN
jgi:hypothetical protein